MSRSKHTLIYIADCGADAQAELDRMTKDANREPQRYMANLQSIFDFPEEKLQFS